ALVATAWPEYRTASSAAVLASTARMTTCSDWSAEVDDSRHLIDAEKVPEMLMAAATRSDTYWTTSRFIGDVADVSAADLLTRVVPALVVDVGRRTAAPVESH